MPRFKSLPLPPCIFITEDIPIRRHPPSICRPDSHPCKGHSDSSLGHGSQPRPVPWNSGSPRLDCISEQREEDELLPFPVSRGVSYIDGLSITTPMLEGAGSRGMSWAWLLSLHLAGMTYRHVLHLELQKLSSWCQEVGLDADTPGFSCQSCN